MKTIDVFYQGEGLNEPEHLEIDAKATFATVKARLIERHAIAADALLFVEDEDEPVDVDGALAKHATPKGLKLHLHRCRHVRVTVTFNGETVDHRFPPSATVARVKRWAAERKFGMSTEEAGEHVLQIAASHERPAPGTHIGALTDHHTCAVAFDLVPDERINGAPDERR